jgi:hypothetical protein
MDGGGANEILHKTGAGSALAADFPCIANVGEDGDSDEKVGDALIEVMSAGAQAAGQCNEGFLRPDSLLIIVILTDENDSSQESSTQAWYDAVVANRGGIAENVVALALTWQQSDNDCTDPFSEVDGYSIREFVQMFPHHNDASICDSSYAGFFSGVIPVIDTACDEFTPPG